ncbi:restriction endonuclease [Gluconobacter japonicus]|uniref:restriction endonuclease n=1 Tax=Gluconobacter japonicus TaxID=376620 RepID=UPI00078394A2|nr:restriction endonuclease [Gluconobacter japonicus]KXV23538.1 restriction endonuclease [Gluconobacter japonicus]KXV41030.1 restriction endonuclease [Gluconobacter japonicus]
MSVPDFSQLMLPVLEFAAYEEKTIPKAVEAISNHFKLSLEDRELLLPSGKQRLIHNRVAWAKTYLAKAGLLETPSRGIFIASAAGRDLLKSHPEAITLTLLKTYPAFQEYYARSHSPGDVQAPQINRSEDRNISTYGTENDTETPEERIDQAQAELLLELKSEILEQTIKQTPAFFEQLIVDLLVAMGYGGSHEDTARRLGGTGDGGIDGVINEDRLGLDRIYVQAKRYAPHVSVGRPDVQAFVGSLVGHGAQKGVFVTTSSFSSPAMEYVKHLPQRIILLDGSGLANLMVEYNVGVRTSRQVLIKRIDLDFFDQII